LLSHQCFPNPRAKERVTTDHHPTKCVSNGSARANAAARIAPTSTTELNAAKETAKEEMAKEE
jgi:hypothetical protein